MILRHSARTDVGRTRDHNEDDFGVGEGVEIERLGNLFVVCDGMGGHAAGEVASKLGVETIIAIYYEDGSDDRPAALRKAFERANVRIHTEGRGTMGTTGVAALLLHNALHIANVGDSRAYLVRDGQIQQISRDHSLVGEQIAAGVITADQARSLYYRNVITRALGYQPDVVVDLFLNPVLVGDLIVLSSDGLHGLITDDEIARIVTMETLADAVDHLVDLANERGGTDNITALVARVDALDPPAQSSDHQANSASDDRMTVEIPMLAPLSPAPSAAAIPQNPVPPAAKPTERRLSLLGGLLAALLLIVLVFAILFTLQVEPVPAPATTAIPTTLLPAPTQSPTPLATVPAAPTIAPTPLATVPIVPTIAPVASPAAAP